MSDTRVSVKPYVIGPSATSFVVPSGDPDLAAWVAAVNTFAGSDVVSATQRTRVGDLITGLKADTDWATLDNIWLFGGENVSQQAAIDIKGLVQGSPVNSPTLSAGGYTGNGTTSYFDTTVTPTGSANYQLDSASLGVYDITNRTTGEGSGSGAIGSSNTTATSRAQISIITDGSATCYTTVHEGSSDIQPASPNAQGMYIATRTASNLEKLFRNGALLVGFNPRTTVSVSPIPQHSFMICGSRYGASPNYYTADTIALGFIGGGLDDAALARVSARFNTYMTAWGINTY